MANSISLIQCTSVLVPGPRKFALGIFGKLSISRNNAQFYVAPLKHIIWEHEHHTIWAEVNV